MAASAPPVPGTLPTTVPMMADFRISFQCFSRSRVFTWALVTGGTFNDSSPLTYTSRQFTSTWHRA